MKDAMNKVSRYVPLIVTVLTVAWLLAAAVPPRDLASGFRVHEFGQLPVVYQGRIKPYDTLARNSLTVISDRQTFRDQEGRSRPAIEWLLDVISNAPAARDYQIFRIYNEQLLTELGLERRQRYRYAFSELEPRLPALEQQAAAASMLDINERDAYDSAVLELYQRVALYRVLSDIYQVPSLGNNPQESLNAAMANLDRLERFSLPHAIPGGDERTESWQPMLRAVLEGAMTRNMNPAVRSMTGLIAAWREGDPSEFNRYLAELQPQLTGAQPDFVTVLRAESAFNNFAPFYRCAVLYVLAFLISCLSWLGWSDVLRRTAFWLLTTTFVVHTLAMAARVYISGYPPITNLYGTAIFIGWGCVLVGLFIERIYPIGVGNLMSAIIGAMTLLIAHFLAGDGDTLEMMQAVLDTKFWLATHVIIINFGYSATFLAGGLSALYILRGVLSRSLDATAEKTFSRMIYGVVSFALLLSFLGTVLGGLWADDSWGRFWGWDPKENGALMIVLWNALILHARWGAMIKTRGIAVLSVLGGIVTAWSWFGVNQLGVGLHSYGFTDSVSFWLLVFAGSQLAIAGLGMLPRTMWRSSANLGNGRTSRRSPLDSTFASPPEARLAPPNRGV